jgi:radical SAM protein with 4Fe4S-binding SPASM domain
MLFDEWQEVAGRLSQGGVKVRLFTSGSLLDAKTLALAQNAGVSEFAVSIDGPAAVHDRLRPRLDPAAKSSFSLAQSALKRLVEHQASVRVVTQVNRINISHLRETYTIVKNLGVKHWQVHLCQATGRARQNRGELLCDPQDLEEIIRVLLLAAKERSVVAPMHCTIGYMTMEEPVLRARETQSKPVWMGCNAGIKTVAITSNGRIKGCTTLPDEFITGSLKERSLADIWADDDCFPYTRRWAASLLAGTCVRCALSDHCRAGCPAVAYGATGTIGANPYCLRLVRQ